MSPNIFKEVIILEFIVLILGLLIGSFLNVCIYRIPRDESIAYPPSHCTSCGKRIMWYDLIPVLSYIFLRGRCRGCGEKISIKYPIIELLTGLAFLGLYIQFGIGFEFVKYAVFICFLIVIGIIDLETTDVYLKTTLSGIILSIIFAIIGNYLNGGMIEYVYGGILGGGLISLIILITKGMGWGDAEICFMCGIFLGLKYTIVMLFLAFISGGIVGIMLIIFKKKTRRDYIPFGPFIALGATFTVFFGERIIMWYLSLL